jgi:hypothetical protein
MRRQTESVKIPKWAKSSQSPIVQALLRDGVPLTRANYLERAGLKEPVDPEMESQFPSQLRYRRARIAKLAEEIPKWAKSSKDPIVQGLLRDGVPVTRANYLEEAGLKEPVDPEVESQFPPHLRKYPEPDTERWIE